MPDASKERLNQIPLVGTSETGRRTKFELGELYDHRDKTVEEVIKFSINEYLGTISINDIKDIVSILTGISIPVTEKTKKHFPVINEMIKRRHNIVHRSDREFIQGSGYYGIKSISIKQVVFWKTCIDRFVKEVNKNFY